MKYKCLILDHDDTVVNSTATIHYPVFLEYLKIYRPNVSMSLDEYFEFNFKPGFTEYCVDTLHLTEEDLKIETKFWLDYVEKHIPSSYEGMRELLEDYVKEGGIICVVSHSMDFNIKRDYEANNLPSPKEIFGWELPSEKRKPSTYALNEIMEKYQLKKSDMVVVDDLLPGKTMANNFGCDFIAACWAHNIKEIREQITKGSLVAYNIDDLRKLIM